MTDIQERGYFWSYESSHPSLHEEPGDFQLEKPRRKMLVASSPVNRLITKESVVVFEGFLGEKCRSGRKEDPARLLISVSPPWSPKVINQTPIKDGCMTVRCRGKKCASDLTKWLSRIFVAITEKEMEPIHTCLYGE